MSSQTLYRKWRSQTFAELIGQEATVRTLKNALTSGKLAHAYLFTRPRGTGKDGELHETLWGRAL